jgi:CrcB protein
VRSAKSLHPDRTWRPFGWDDVVSTPGWIAVAVLGSVGSIARFLVDRSVSRHTAARFPLGTLAVNASGALLLGLLTGLALSGEALVLAGSATLGSYTTFSTWMLETHKLGEDGQLAAGAANVLVSMTLGIGAALLGRAIGGAL